MNKYGSAIFSPIYVTFEILKNYNCDFIGAILTSQNFINKIRRFEEGSLYERQAVKSSDFIKEAILIPDKSIQDNIAKIILDFNKQITLSNEKLKLLWVKRDTETGRFIDVKTSSDEPFKGITKEK